MKTNLAERFSVDCPLNATYEVKGSPERNLLMAMLERSILDFVGNDSKDIESSEKWIFEDLNNHAPYSFNWVCSELDLEPKDIAEIIHNMPKRGNNRVAPWYFMKNEKKKAA